MICTARSTRSSSPALKITRLGLRPRLLEHRPHDQAGLEDELVELLAVGLEIGDRPRRHARVHGGPATAGASSTISRGSNGLGMIWLAPKPPPACSPKARATTSDGSLCASDGQRAHAGDLHLVVDRRGPDIERAAEDVGEAEDVVHLVGIVAAAGGDDGVVAHGGNVLRRDLRIGVGERQDQRLGRHLGDHLLLEHAARRQAEEDVGAARSPRPGCAPGCRGHSAPSTGPSARCGPSRPRPRCR